MAYIKIVNPNEAEGKLKEVYQELRLPPGSRLPEIRGVFTLEPGLLRWIRDASPDIVYGTTDFDAVKAELIATTVSAINGCHY